MHRTPRRFLAICAFAPGLLVSSLGCGQTRHTSPRDLSPADADAIKATTESYRRSWLSGDAEGVLATFTEDAVLLPHHGDPPITGKPAIRNYWFAPGPATTITELNMTIDRVSGNEGLAFAHGHDTVSWTTTSNGTTTRSTNSGTYLNVLKKGADGSWRIQAHMWDDPPNQRQ